MKKQVQCCLCSKIVSKKLSDTLKPKTGRPWKRLYCSKACYNRERANQQLEAKRRWLHYQRQVWGTTELKRMDVAKCKSFGRQGEVLARDRHLPAEGFTNIVDFSGHTNQFFVDFVATYQGERVLIDATIRLHASIPNKIFMAKALGMRLFIIFVSLKDTSLFFIKEVPPLSRAGMKIPAGFIRKSAIERGLGDWASHRTVPLRPI